MVNRKEYTIMMLKKAMSDHNKEMRHKGLWKMTHDQIHAYIRSQSLEIKIMPGRNKDTTPFIKLVSMRDPTRAQKDAGITDRALHTGKERNNMTRKVEYVDARYRGDRRTGRARQFLKPDGNPKGTRKRQGAGRQR